MKRKRVGLGWCGVLALAAILLVAGSSPRAYAAGAFPDENASGSVGLQGTISTAAPTQAATIAVPSNGAVFSAVPITVSGLCPSNLLVKVFDNNVFVGSTTCVNGSYSVQISLFSGQNDLVARVYDALDQAGPDSNTVTVTFNDAQFIEFGTHVTLTSDYAERGAPPGQQLEYPIILSGGNGPYALSVDWGDGSPPTLLSEATTGTIDLTHTYTSAGIYRVIIQATDKNGGTAFLQVVTVATGATQNNSTKNSSATTTRTIVIWWPALAMIPLIFAAFWVGQRYELFTLRKNIEKSRDNEDG